MENHPIPQDVTGFKFKIIGSITIKQFGYLLGFGILATITLFLLPLPALVKLPLTFIFVVIGVALAFIPIDGRPLDLMIVNFAKAVQAENQYLFHKGGEHILALDILSIPVKKTSANTVPSAASQALNKRMMLRQAFQNSYTKIDDENAQAVGQILSSFNSTTQPVIPLAATRSQIQTSPTVQAAPLVQDSVKTQPVAIPIADPTGSTPGPHVILPDENPTPQQQLRSIPTSVMEVVQKQEARIQQNTKHEVENIEHPKTEEEVKETLNEIQKEIIDVQNKEITEGKSNDLEGKIKQLQMQLNEVLAEKENLEKKMYTMENKRDGAETFTPTNTNFPANKTDTKNAQVVNTAPKQFDAGFPSLPDVANVVLGIVKDARGKVLPNILVEVQDQNDVPVRAFKTNALGQFASATPLPNGTYKVYFEDPQSRHEFDTIEITLTGDEIFNPLEITSVDQREKLRRELFAPNVPPVQ